MSTESYLLRHAKIFDQVLVLDEQQALDPYVVIDLILSHFPLSCSRFEVLRLVEWVFTADNEEFSEASERASAYNFLGNVILLFEAAFILLKQKNAKVN